MPSYRIETPAIASVTLYVDAETPQEAMAEARQASDDGGTALRRWLTTHLDDSDIEALSLATATIEEEEI